MADAPVPIIVIKRIKKGAHGHHGGAWKVAYADFVTAMMAFFLLLWLLNVTTPEQKMGLAEYFTPTIGIKDSMGIGFKGGQKASIKVGRSVNDLTAPGLVAGQPQQGSISGPPNQAQVKPDAESSAEVSDSNDTTDSEQFNTTSEDVKQALQEDPELKDYKNDVILQDSPEGLKIDLIDDEKKPMFAAGGAMLTDKGKKVLDSMAAIIAKTPNNITIKGNTDSASGNANPQYTNWELSADRANAARRFLASTQLETDRVQKVVGMADRELLSPQEPSSPRNRRITIVLMRGSYYRDPQVMPTTRSLLSVPHAKPKKK